MNQKNPKGDNGAPSNFESGFGGSMFGGNTNSQFNNAGGSNFGGGAGGGAGGEFGSGFGGTNAVSQIFKDGGFAQDDKKKKLVIIGAVAVAAAACLGAVYFLFFSSEEAGVDQTAAVETPAADAAPAASAEEVMEEGESLEDDAVEGAPAAEAPAATTGATMDYTYDEEAGGPVVKVQPGETVEVSRSQSFGDTYVRGVAGANGDFRIPNPPPGKIFWRTGGSNSVNEININPAPGLGLQFSAPSQLAAGGELSWSASGPVSFFRVEFATDNDFKNISTVFSTSQNSVAIKDVAAGQYFVRLGGFNKAAGKWEYSSKASVNVQ